MSESSYSKRHLKAVLFVANLVLLVVLLIAVEITLKVFFPFRLVTIGHTDSPNARLYGWGYNPHETLDFINPDTGGKIVYFKVNNSGWKDVDRTFENQGGSFRILVLGDSVTFGVVPLKKTYTSFLENLFREEGYNVEVVNIGYGGWGTDQELEAYKNVGVLYKPDIVIWQFSTNDLADNAYIKDDPDSDLKPFYYELSSDNKLLRSPNKNFHIDDEAFLKTSSSRKAYLIKQALFKSEIMKRVYSIYFHYRNAFGYRKHGEYVELSTNYKIDDGRIRHLKSVIGQEHTLFFDSLNKLNNGKVEFNEITDLIDKSNLNDKKQTILRLLEDRWFWKYLDIGGYDCPGKINPEDYRWKLYFKIVEQGSRLTKENGSDLILFSQDDIGYLGWVLYWYGIKNEDECKKNFLDPTYSIRRFAEKHKIRFIEQTEVYTRYRNDSHPNEAGNLAIARDMFKYIIAHYEYELDEYKIK